MQIIPAMDIINGKCVRLTKGDYTQQKTYSDNPIEVAKSFEEEGFTRLHLVDLDGAKAGTIQNLKVLEAIASHTNLQIDFGGGIKTIEDASAVFDAGAALITLGSIAVKNAQLVEEWVIEFGCNRILVGADVLNNQIKISGWLEDGGITIFDFIRRMLAIGIRNIFCTDISKDGMMKGPSLVLYKKIIEEFTDLNFIASGGVSTLDDVVALKQIGCNGVIIGKAIYEQSITLKELSILNKPS